MILDGGRCSVVSMNSPEDPVATASERWGSVRGEGLWVWDWRTVLVEALDVGREAESLGVLAVDAVDELSEVGPWRLWRGDLGSGWVSWVACGRTEGSHLGGPARLAVPALVGYVVELERRLEARKVKRAQAATVAAEKVAFAAAGVTEVVVGLHAVAGVSSSRPLQQRVHTSNDTSPSTVVDFVLPPTAIERRARALPPLAGLRVAKRECSPLGVRDRGAHLNLMLFFGRLALPMGALGSAAPMVRFAWPAVWPFPLTTLAPTPSAGGGGRISSVPATPNRATSCAASGSSSSTGATAAGVGGALASRDDDDARSSGPRSIFLGRPRFFALGTSSDGESMRARRGGVEGGRGPTWWWERERRTPATCDRILGGSYSTSTLLVLVFSIESLPLSVGSLQMQALARATTAGHQLPPPDACSRDPQHRCTAWTGVKMKRELDMAPKLLPTTL